MSQSAAAAVAGEVAAYKAVLKRVLDNRPSGTRQRLAAILGKNRSFVSQIANPTLPVPIPPQHLEAIFEVCHFAAEDRRLFLAAYARAHPGRSALTLAEPRTRTLSLTVPDLGSARRNRAMDLAIADLARRLARFADDLS